MKEWTVLDRTPLTQADGTQGDWGKYVGLEVWKVKYNPTGQVIDYAVVLEDDSVSVAGITERGEIVLISHERLTAGRIIEAIGGGMKPGELPRQAAVREFMEEGGLQPQRLVYLGQHFQSSSRVVSRNQSEIAPRTEHSFLAFDLKPIGTAKDEHEDISLVQIPFAAIRAAALDPEWLVPGFGQILTGSAQNIILKSLAMGFLN